MRGILDDPNESNHSQLYIIDGTYLYYIFTFCTVPALYISIHYSVCGSVFANSTLLNLTLNLQTPIGCPAQQKNVFCGLRRDFDSHHVLDFLGFIGNNDIIKPDGDWGIYPEIINSDGTYSPKFMVYRLTLPPKLPTLPLCAAEKMAKNDQKLHLNGERGETQGFGPKPKVLGNIVIKPKVLGQTRQKVRVSMRKVYIYI